MTPDPGGSVFQTGDGEDPLVWVNGRPGWYELEVTHSGHLWRNPYTLSMQPGVVTFGAPEALVNITGFLFANRATGQPVAASTTELIEDEVVRTSITDFLGQFIFIGLDPGRFYVQHLPPGLMPGVGWPIEVEEDTTLSQVVFHSDTLAAWSVSGGGPPLDPTRGHLVVDIRSKTGGSPLVGYFLLVDPVPGAVSVPQRSAYPALLINASPGSYTIRVADPSGLPMDPTPGVTVHPGRVGYQRIDL
jgi:hypothetical protein